MNSDSIELNFLTIFALITFLIFLSVQKYLERFNKGILLDRDFKKPQAFHTNPTFRSGGIACMISFSLFLIIYNLLFSRILYDYFFISFSLFLIGFLDDTKINTRPLSRLFLMIISLLIAINYLSINIKVDLMFLDSWLQNKFILNIFVLLCFLFIINGANLVDGFNGLLGINLLIVNFILLLLNLENNKVEFSVLLAGQSIIIISFLLFNFPKAKMFLGDGGSYFLGSITALNAINTNNFNPEISSYFFCILLFYLFFEVFFSFFRKLFLKKSPLKPDNLHLHMLCFKVLKKFFPYKDCNYINSIFINLIFVTLVVPAVFFRNSAIICKYWFFSILIIYTLGYFRLYRFTKN